MYTVDIDYQEELNNAVSIAREGMPDDIRRLINSLKYDLYYGPYDEGYEDGDDFYYITYNGREITWNSAVGKLIYLKGKIDDSDYNEFIRLAKLNHWDQIEVEDIEGNIDVEFNSRHKDKVSSCDGEDKYLTDICWDLN